MGYFLVPFVVGYLGNALGVASRANSDDAQLVAIFSAVAWVAVLAFCARFLLGRQHANPGGMWTCPNCKYLNQPYVVLCEACRQPYKSKS